MLCHNNNCLENYTIDTSYFIVPGIATWLCAGFINITCMFLKNHNILVSQNANYGIFLEFRHASHKKSEDPNDQM